MAAFCRISLALAALAVFVLVSVVTADEATPPAPPESTQLPTPKVKLTATPLYAPPAAQKAGLTCLVTSPDGKRFAALYGNTLVIDGKEIKDYDIVRQPVFSPDSQHCAFAGISVDNQKCYIVTDGVAKEVEGFVSELAFSPDSKRLACITRIDAKYCLVVDGVKGKLYDDVMPLMLQSVMKKDSKAAPQGIFFSPDSQHIVYLAREGLMYLVVLDGKESQPYNNVNHGGPFSGCVLTQHAEHLVYHAEYDKKSCIVLDGEDCKYLLVALSPDGAHIAFSAIDFDAKTARVILDGKEGTQFKEAGRLVFSPDSQRLAYWAKDDNGAWLVVDGKQYSLPESHASQPVFSPDSKHVAIATNHSVMVDDINHNMKTQPLGNIIFSPDSKRIAFKVMGESGRSAAGMMGEPHYSVQVALDFITGPEYESLGDATCGEFDDPIYFTPDSKHVVYFGKRDNDYFAVVDGAETLLDLVPYTQPVFDSPAKFHFIAIRNGREVILVEAEITD